MRVHSLMLTRIKVALFAVFLVVPLLSLAVFGVTDIYGGSDHPEFPRIGQVLKKRGKLDEFGNAVLHRSVAMKEAIRLRSWIGYRLVGFVDAERVVSGEAGWLFYREEFAKGACLNADRAARNLEQLETLIDLSRAAGIDMIVSVSPDKSTIYPEMLNQTMRGYWRCRPHNGLLLRALMRDHAPRLIDHAPPILAEKARDPGRLLYYVTDTHWTPMGAAAALRQLLDVALPGADIPPPTASTEMLRQATDLSIMLLLQRTEAEPRPARDWRAALPGLNPNPQADRTLLIRDSFYGVLLRDLRAIFPGLRELGYKSKGKMDTSAIATADRIIVNSVERSLLERIKDGPLDWDAPITAALVARNRARAEACTDFTPVASQRIGFVIPAPPVGALPCLRVTARMKMAAANLVIALAGASGAFVPGHAIELQVTQDDARVTLVLPEGVTAARLSLNPKRADLDAVEIGRVARPDLPSDHRPSETP